MGKINTKNDFLYIAVSAKKKLINIRVGRLQIFALKCTFMGQNSLCTRNPFGALANFLQHLGYKALLQPSINISVHECAIYVLRVVAFCSMLRHISIWNMPLCALSCKLQYYYYGNTGCGVFKRGVQNQKKFCLKINILKGNY